jgi:hypothetical protein
LIKAVREVFRAQTGIASRNQHSIDVREVPDPDNTSVRDKRVHSTSLPIIERSSTFRNMRKGLGQVELRRASGVVVSRSGRGAAARKQRGFGAVADLKPLEKIGHIVLHGPFRELELCGDLLVTEALPNEL